MSKTILMVDDEESFTELTKTLLNFHEYEVDAYNNPIDVEKAVDAKEYALIISDLMMPNVDGFALVKMVRAKEKYKEVPIIVLSAKTLSDDERKFLLQNKVHFLTKPFDPHGLVDQVQELLS